MAGCGVRPRLQALRIARGEKPDADGGSGFLIRWSGRLYVVTNHHVAEGPLPLTAVDETGARATLRYVAGVETAGFPAQPESGYYADWAVLEIASGTLRAAPVPLRAAPGVYTGPAFTRGYPEKELGESDLVVRAYQDRLLAGEMARTMWFGASGSAVVDCAGELVGAVYGTCREPKCFGDADVPFSAAAKGLMENRITPVQALLPLLDGLPSS